MSEPVEAPAPAPGLGRAVLLYTAVRLAVFVLAFLAAAAVVLPSTSGAPAPRLLICALAAAVVSVPVSWFAGRRWREQVAAALLAARVERDRRDAEYDARLRAGRRGPAS